MIQTESREKKEAEFEGKDVGSLPQFRADVNMQALASGSRATALRMVAISFESTAIAWRVSSYPSLARA